MSQSDVIGSAHAAGYSITSRSRWTTLAVLATILVGAMLRLVELGASRSFSVDEAALARNVVVRSWGELLGRLDFIQVAPPFFLWLQKASLALGIDMDLALRVSPFVAGVLTLPIAWIVGRTFFGGAATVAYVGLLAICTPLIAYAATAKPYSLEVTASLLTILMAGDTAKCRSTARAVLLGAASASLALLSYTTVFTLAAAAIAACIRGVRHRHDAPWVPQAVFAAFCLAGALIGVALGRAAMSADDSDYMHWFWTSGFVPIEKGPGDVFWWLWQRSTGFFSQTLHYRFALVWVALALAGVASLGRRRAYEDAVLLLSPVVLLLAASALHAYPIATGRVVFFLIPSALAVVTVGAEASGRLLRRFVPGATALPLLIVGALGVHALVRTDVPREPLRHPIRPFLDRVARDWSIGDALFVHYDDAQPFLYYAPRYQFRASDVHVGACARGAARRYLQDVSAFAGRSRVWIAMTHHSTEETDLLRAFLDASGRRIALNQEDLVADYGYLYDLSASAYSAVSADTFPVPADLDTGVLFARSCDGVWSPLPPDSH